MKEEGLSIAGQASWRNPPGGNTLWQGKRGIRHVSLCHLWGSTLFILLLVMGCASLPWGEGEYLAKVNGVPISIQDLRQEFKRRHGGHLALLKGEKPLRTVLNTIVDSRLLIEEGYRLNLHKERAVRERVEAYEGQLIKRALLQDEVEKNISVSDDEVRTLHERLPHLIRVRYILVPTQAEAEEVAARIAAGEDFARLAGLFSRHSSAARGGYLGFVRWGKEDPALEEVAIGLKPGEVSKPFRVGEGVGILKVEARTEAQAPPLSEVKRQLRGLLQQQKRSMLRQKLLASLRSRARIEIREEAISSRPSGPDGEARAAEEVYARVNDREIRLAEIRRFLARRRALMQAATPRQVLDEMIDEGLLLEEGRRRKYHERAEIAQKVKLYEEDMVREALLRDFVYRGITATITDAEEYYKEHPEEFQEPEKVELAHIVLETREEADEVWSALKRGEEFGRLARERSVDKATGPKGGKVGWFKRGELIPSVEEVAFSLQVGEVSAPLEERSGYLILKLLGKKEASLPRFSSVQKKARLLLLQKRREEKLRFWVERLRANAVIEFNEKALKRLAKQTLSVQPSSHPHPEGNPRGNVPASMRPSSGQKDPFK